MLIRTILVILLINCALLARAQDELALKFGTLNSLDGLSHNSVNDLIVDDYGFLWIGTMDGLNRYDGSKFELFRHIPGDSTSLMNNTVWSLAAGKDQEIIIGTANGLCRYSYHTNTFDHIELTEEDKAIRHITVDGTGQIWASSDTKGLFRIEDLGGGNTAVHYITEQNANYVNFVVQDHIDSTRIWISGKGGLKYFNNTSHEIIDWRDKINHPELQSAIISSLVQDAKGRLWMGTNTYGLFRFDPKSHELRQFIPDDRDPKSIGSTNVADIAIDRDGSLWISSFGEGLSIMTDTERGIFQNYKKKDFELYALKNNTLTKVFSDNQGRVWIGTHGSGLQYYDQGKAPFDLYRENENNQLSISGNNITSIYEDKDGNTWVGTRERGINKIKWTARGDKISALQSYTADESNPNSLNINSTNSYIESNRFGLIIGNRLGGINIYESEKDRFRDYFVYPGDADLLKNYHVNDMYITGEDNIWFATSIGVYLWDSDKQELINYNLRHPDLAALDDIYVRFIFERDKVLWIGASNVGLWAWDLQKKELHTYDNTDPAGSGLNTNNLLCYHLDKRGNLWIGTWEGGLNMMDLSTERFDYYTEANGLSNSVIYSVQEDDNEYLWLSTNNGIIRFDPASETFNSYGINDGLQGEEYNANAGYRSSTTGHILFGGMNGLNQFDPARIKLDTFIPDIHITSLLLHETNSEMPLDLTGSLNNEKLTISHRTYLVECGFGAPKLPSSSNVRFAYRVRGLSDRWINLEQRKEFALTNLTPGTYTLDIRSGLDGGRWSDDIRSLSIISLPPWWQTWWAYLLYVTVGCSILYFIYKSRVSQLVKYQRLRTQISSDLHDDVGTILSAMAFQTEILELEQDPSEKDKFKKITYMSRLALGRMRDTVWAIDSRKDNAESLVDRMEDFLFDAFEGQEIGYKFNKNILSNDLKIRPDIRQSVYLVFKEAVTNALKHTNGDHIKIDLDLDGKGFGLTVHDNGKVDAATIKKSGLGLSNMQARAEKVGADFSINYGDGFKVELRKV